MAYNKMVVWPSPFDNQTLPYGYHGITYTYVSCDVPLYEFKREIYFPDGSLPDISNPEGITTLYTTIPYRAKTLELYANGKRVEVKEERTGRNRKFTVRSENVVNKYIYCSYVPFNLRDSLGDNRAKLREVYGVECQLRYSKRIRETIQQIRSFITKICIAIEIEPPLWYGGFGNRTTDNKNNIIPGLTPMNKELHMQPIEKSVNDIIKWINSRTTKKLKTVTGAAYTIEFLSAVEETLIEIDELLEEMLQ